MKYHQILFSIFFLSLSSITHGSYSHYFWLPKLFNAPNYQLDKKEFLQLSKQAKNPYEYLEGLLKRYPDLKSTYTLVHTSKSLQSASKAEPRIIFYAPNGVFFSFGSDDETKRVEMINFNQAQRRFDFTEVTFERGKPSINRRPKTCFACHQGQPIWDNYHSWPGVYGSDDDYVFINRMKETAFAERERLKELIEGKKNKFLQLLEAKPDDFFLTGNHEVNLKNIFSPKRRNSYFLYHLGYYSLLTQYDGVKPNYSNNLSFLNTSGANYGGEFPYQLAAKTMTLGFKSNELFQYVDYNGNRADKLKIPKGKQQEYDTTYKSLKLYTEKKSIAPMAKCITCHAINYDEVGAPFIPFNNIKKLKKYLTHDENRKELLWRVSFKAQETEDRMPPDESMILSEKDQQALMDLMMSL
ncbi:hypothetical protein N9N67_11030 [Bacteriovoracaceae bacterium]|nr:hypothetical protein [Bacteriovoracaceae bacterium]